LRLVKTRSLKEKESDIGWSRFQKTKIKKHAHPSFTIQVEVEKYDLNNLVDLLPLNQIPKRFKEKEKKKKKKKREGKERTEGGQR